MNGRHRVRAAFTLTLCIGAGAPGFARPGPVSGVDQGTAAVAWLAQQSCPLLGNPIAVPGLETPGQVAQVRKTALDYARNQTQALLAARDARNRVTGERQAEGRDPSAQRNGLNRLDAATAEGVGRMAATLTRWLLADWVDMAALPPDWSAEGRAGHPLLPFVDRAREVEALVRRLDGLPEVVRLLVPVVQRSRLCLVTAQNQMVDANADALVALAANATAPAALRDALARYVVVDASFGAGMPGLAPPPAVATLRDRIAELEVAERVRAAESQKRAELAAAERDRAVRDRLEQEAQRNLRVAERFAALIRSHNAAAMSSLLHPDVVLTGPSGSRSGRDTVISTLSQILSQAQSFSLGTPALDRATLTIVAPASTSRGPGRLSFRFSGGLISQLQISG